MNKSSSAVSPVCATLPPSLRSKRKDHGPIECGAVVRWPPKRANAQQWINAADLPDVSKRFRGIAQGTDQFATLHGVVFDILVGAASRAVVRGPPSPDGLRRGSLGYDVACQAVAGVASEGWWARQDSNLQPDRYERQRKLFDR
jgi:hypothetical protein